MKRHILFFALLAMILFSACNVANSRPFGTPIPTLIPATLPAEKEAGAASEPKCSVRAVDLLGAWVKAGTPETDPFDFIAEDGAGCQGVFEADILPLFTKSNLWYNGAASCVSCHKKDLATSNAQMYLGSYADILAGSRRKSADEKGNDILGGSDWEKSKLYEVLAVTKLMPVGRPADAPVDGPLVQAGKPK